MPTTPRVTSSLEALKKAAALIADAAKANASKFSKGIPAAFRTYTGPGSKSVYIAAGKRGGKWGWEPINAWMFETPGARHPFFGHDPWYTQPYRPFLEEAAEATASRAADIYADLSIKQWATQGGFK